MTELILGAVAFLAALLGWTLFKGGQKTRAIKDLSDERDTIKEEKDALQSGLEEAKNRVDTINEALDEVSAGDLSLDDVIDIFREHLGGSGESDTGGSV